MLGSVQPREVEQIRLGILWRHRSLKSDAASAGHREHVAIPVARGPRPARRGRTPRRRGRARVRVAAALSLQGRRFRHYRVGGSDDGVACVGGSDDGIVSRHAPGDTRTRALVPVHIHGGDRSELSVFLALCRHRIAQGSRLLGQPLDLRRSSRRPALFTTDIADRFEIGEQFVEEGE
jgi:hypothetical protein